MGNRLLYPHEGSGNPGEVYINFRFFPNGTNTSALVIAPAFTATSTSNNMVASVIRTSTAGQFTILLQDPWSDCVNADASAHLNTPATNAGFTFSSASFGAATASSIVCNFVPGGSATDIASNANNWIYIALIVKNSSLVM